MAGRGKTADLAAAVDDDPPVAAGTERSVTARVRDQSLRVSDLGVSVGNAGIDAADEHARRDHRQLLSRLSQAVGRLEKRTWPSRQPDEEDSRYTLAVLTSAGLHELEEIAPSHVTAVRELVFDRLTRAQTRQLGTIWQLILDGLPPDDSWPSIHAALRSPPRLSTPLSRAQSCLLSHAPFLVSVLDHCVFRNRSARRRL